MMYGSVGVFVGAVAYVEEAKKSEMVQAKNSGPRGGF